MGGTGTYWVVSGQHGMVAKEVEAFLPTFEELPDTHTQEKLKTTFFFFFSQQMCKTGAFHFLKNLQIYDIASSL